MLKVSSRDYTAPISCTNNSRYYPFWTSPNFTLPTSHDATL